MTERCRQDFRIYYDIIEEIGSGAYSFVYKGKEIRKNQLRAIKVINLESVKENLSYQYEPTEIEEEFELLIKGFIKEFQNMKKCSENNSNSVKCYEYFYFNDTFTIIMELCDSNLSTILTNKLIKYEKGYNPDEILDIMNQLYMSFKIMKENEIIHGNLKLENILIQYDERSEDFIIKIADYACSRRIESLLISYCNTNIDNIIYMAPELLKGKGYNYKCDLWSIGMIIYRLMFGKSPFIGEGNTIIENIDKLGSKLFKKTGNKYLDDLIKQLLEKDIEKRITWDEYFEHKFFKTRFRNKINIIYFTEYDGTQYIFGENFVENNKNKIELEINGVPNELVKKYKLKKGENIIKIIIKNKKITNLEDMFYKCSTLKNIEELEYLDTIEVTNFSGMFHGCSSLSDLNGLEKWNVWNGTNFSNMFSECSSLTDLKPLSKWKVLNGDDFSFMFNGCSSLSNLRGLDNWSVSKGNNFSCMFHGCSSLSDIISLDRWNVSNGNNFSYMFSECLILKDLKGLENWNVSKGNNFSGIFYECPSLSDLKGLENWNVSKGENFSSMFSGCSSISNIKPLIKWNTSNGTNFSYMFLGCKSLQDIKQIEQWKIPKKEFNNML